MSAIPAKLDPTGYLTFSSILAEAQARNYSFDVARKVYTRRTGQVCPFHESAHGVSAASSHDVAAPIVATSEPLFEGIKAQDCYLNTMPKMEGLDQLSTKLVLPLLNRATELLVRARRCTLDFETRSRCDLLAHGSAVYAEHESTIVLCLAYKFGDGETKLWLPIDGDCPPEIVAHIENGGIVEAHNAAFEQDIWEYVCVARMGWPRVPITSWRDSMALCVAMAIPQSLANATAALGTNVQKDMGGKAVMLKLSQPRKATKADASEWNNDPALFDRLYSYCKQDVDAEHSLSTALPALSAPELEVWHASNAINRRGIYCDRDAIGGALRMIALAETDYHAEVARVTGGVLTGEDIGSWQKVLPWCAGRGVHLDNYQKGTLAEAIKADMPDDVRTVLTTRLALGRTSTAKYQSMLDRANADSRIRGTLIYHGATTGRWTGRGIQPQNLPKGTLTPQAVDDCLADMRRLDLDDFRFFWGDPLAAASDCLRGCLTAAPGKDLIAADYGAIEARVLLWLANDPGLQVFRDGRDIYKEMAAAIFRVPIDQVTKVMRALGKIAILGLGYGMGMNTFIATCANFGIVIDAEMAQRVVDTYREKYPNVKALWYELDGLAIAAVRSRTVTSTADRRIQFKMIGEHLKMRLPSGRLLTYPYAKVELRETPWGAMKDAVTFMGENVARQWVRMHTYGGSIVENCLGKDTLVVTPEGAKRIVDVAPGDSVWDGRRWVRTDGVVDQGEQEVGEWLGVQVTRNHLIHDGDSWKPVIELDDRASLQCLTSGRASAPWWSYQRSMGETGKPSHDAIAEQRGVEFAAISGEGNPAAGNVGCAKADFADGCTLALLRTKPCGCSGSAATAACSPGATTQSTLPTKITVAAASRCGILGGTASQLFSAMCKPFRAGMSWAWTWIESKTSKDTDLETSASVPAPKMRTIPVEPFNCDTKASGTPTPILGGNSAPSGAPTLCAGTSTKDATPSMRWRTTGERSRVYDLLNCGPRHAFTILTAQGPVLVHNCVQAAARDLMASAIVRAEKRDLPVVLTVHDELVSEIDETNPVTTEEFAAMMCENPPWAEGLPVVAEGWRAKRYQK